MLKKSERPEGNSFKKKKKRLELSVPIKILDPRELEPQRCQLNLQEK